MIPRLASNILQQRFQSGKTLIVLGPRQVGKTTLIRSCLENCDYLFLDGDDPFVRQELSQAGLSKLKAIIGNKEWVFIDEAQRISDVGLIAKIIHDQLPQVQLILSGSSALELNNTLQEPLTGRKFECKLFPISWEEFENHFGFLEANAQLEERLIFGMYPDVISHRSDARERIMELASSYLYKDLLALSGIKKPDFLQKLLQALALQLGSEVSLNELAQLLGIDKNTVSKYLDLLEKAFIIFRLPSFSRNQRNEIKNNRKIYFFDNGIRNAVINHFNSWELRSDRGALWENFLLAERMKANSYKRYHKNYYFWRTTTQQEVDLIEEENGELFAFEFKWKANTKDKIPASFLNTYAAPDFRAGTPKIKIRIIAGFLSVRR